MKTQRILIVGGVTLTLLTGVLLQDTHIRRLVDESYRGFSSVILDLLTIAWWCLAGWILSTLAKRLFHQILFPRDGQPRRRKILADLTAALIYLGTFIGILKYGLHQPVSGLLATSGIAALVLGLALQSTLADLFSGIALNIESPFRAGDWITVDGGNAGQVIEINWRSTRIRDPLGNVVVVPNSQIAKTRVTNHSMHRKTHGGTIVIDFDADASTALVSDLLIAAARDIGTVLTDPPPEVSILEIRRKMVTYCLSFTVAEFIEIAPAQSDMYKRVLSRLSSSTLQLACNRTEVFLLNGERKEKENHHERLSNHLPYSAGSPT